MQKHNINDSYFPVKEIPAVALDVNHKEMGIDIGSTGYKFIVR